MRFGIWVIAAGLLFTAGCDQQRSEKREEKNILQEYVETPLERAHELDDHAKERTKDLTDELDAASTD